MEGSLGQVETRHTNRSFSIEEQQEKELQKLEKEGYNISALIRDKIDELIKEKTNTTQKPEENGGET